MNYVILRDTDVALELLVSAFIIASLSLCNACSNSLLQLSVRTVSQLRGDNFPNVILVSLFHRVEGSLFCIMSYCYHYSISKKVLVHQMSLNIEENKYS